MKKCKTITLQIVNMLNSKNRFIQRPLWRLAAMIPFALLLFACAAPKAKSNTLARIAKPAPTLEPVKTVELRFHKSIKTVTPAKEPDTVKEHIGCGLFLFDRERYEDAAVEFERACLDISGHQSPLYRTCLMSAAVCRLISNDKQAFFKNMRALKFSYNKYEWMDKKGRDDRLKALYDLYNEFIKTGNF